MRVLSGRQVHGRVWILILRDHHVHIALLLLLLFLNGIELLRGGHNLDLAPLQVLHALLATLLKQVDGPTLVIYNKLVMRGYLLEMKGTLVSWSHQSSVISMVSFALTPS